MVRLPSSSVTSARYPAVDAHNHLGRWLSRDNSWMVKDVPALVTQMDSHNIATTLNLDGRWGDELALNLDRYDHSYPGRFATLCHVDWRELSRRDGPERLVRSLERSAAAGARGLKVWKDLGLRVRDGNGTTVLPDDARLRPLWDAAAALELPVVIHTADPAAFFRPVDARNERVEELLRSPRLAVADAPYGFSRLIDALEATVAGSPATTFVGAHVGCHAEDLEWVRRMLATYPNFVIDIAGRIAELGRQPRAARRLIIDYPDRVLFGTDNFPPNADELGICFRFLESDDEYFPYSTAEIPLQGRWAISGLDLPSTVLQLVYCENARDVFRLGPTPRV